jgi:hypothetical protein
MRTSMHAQNCYATTKAVVAACVCCISLPLQRVVSDITVNDVYAR